MGCCGASCRPAAEPVGAMAAAPSSPRVVAMEASGVASCRPPTEPAGATAEVPSPQTCGVVKQVDGYDDVVLRAEPSGTITGVRVPNGESVIILEKEGNNVKVRWKGSDGWVRAANIQDPGEKRADVPPQQARGVAKQVDGYDDVVLRSGPSGTVTGVRVPNGESVIILQKEGNNVKVRWKGSDGWARAANIQEPEEKKQAMNAETCFAAGDVKIIDAEWLVLQPNSRALQRCQDLPKDANVPKDKISSLWQESMEAGGSVKAGIILAFSYGWLTAVHPDPRCFYLRLLQKFIPLVKTLGYDTISLFWDFLSLPQRKRTHEEERSFQRGLQIMTAIYGMPFTKVLQIKCLPEPFEGMNCTPYNERGWCHFEERIASIIKPGWMLLDLSPSIHILEAGVAWRNPDRSKRRPCNQAMAAVREAGVGLRRPPLHPDDMQKELQIRKFTNGADLDTVVRIYRAFFDSIVPTTTKLELGTYGDDGSRGSWGMTEAMQLAQVLPEFQGVIRLDLGEHVFGDEGLRLLLEPIANLPQLVELDFRGENTFSEEGLKAFYQKMQLMSLKALALPRRLEGTVTGTKISSWWKANGGKLQRGGVGAMYNCDGDSHHIKEGLWWAGEW